MGEPRWPPHFRALLGRLSRAVEWLLRTECDDLDDFAASWLLRVVGWPGLLLLVLVLRFLWERQVAKSALAGKHARRNAELVAFVVYPTVVYAAFAAFNCRCAHAPVPRSRAHQ